MVNEIPVSTIEKAEIKHLRRWLGVPPSFSNIGLYGSSNKLQMPFSSLVEEFKVAKARQLLTLRDSADDKISGAGIQVRIGRKWLAGKAVCQAESNLQHQDIVGTTNKGREGLGTKQRQRWTNANNTVYIHIGTLFAKLTKTVLSLHMHRYLSAINRDSNGKS